MRPWALTSDEALSCTLTGAAASPDTGVPAGQKLIQQSQVAVAVGVVNSATALGLVQQFNAAKVPLIIANAGANALTGAKASAYVWRTSFSNDDAGASMGAYVASRVDSGACTSSRRTTPPGMSRSPVSAGPSRLRAATSPGKTTHRSARRRTTSRTWRVSSAPARA